MLLSYSNTSCLFARMNWSIIHWSTMIWIFWMTGLAFTWCFFKANTSSSAWILLNSIFLFLSELWSTLKRQLLHRRASVFAYWLRKTTCHHLIIFVIAVMTIIARPWVMAAHTEYMPSGYCTVLCAVHCSHPIIYTVSQKNIPNVFSHNSWKHCRIFIIFGRNITRKESNQKMLHFSTLPN